ncbi:MAG: hypothetical protein JO272_14715 [Pseudonocardiales bacterium]|nr:hypothetical protein [Pseudonocardiales bacterium]
MPLRDAVEEAIRRWDALERSRGEAPVIDFDCAPPGGQPSPYDNRFAALDDLTRLRIEADTHHQPALRTQLDAHIAYLGALIGQQLPLDEYISLTQGCMPRSWTRDYIEQYAWVAREALESLGISWDEDTWTNLHAASEQLSAADVSSAIAEYADKYESSIRRLVDTDADFNLTIEDVEVDAYWSYWLDGTGHDTRLRINKSRASFSRVDAYRFALHEVLGHALQYSSLTAQAESHTVEWPRILAVHCPHQVLFEGLAQVLPWVASPDDEIICARTRIDHFMNLVRGQIHILVNSGMTAAACRDLARRHVPWWTDEEIARELYDRSRNPQLRSYLWAYPAGMDWFVKLVEAGGATLAEVLREAYRRPLTPSELHQLWPTGPIIGGNQ